MGRSVLGPAEEDAQSKTLQWELRGRNGKEKEQRQEAEELGAGAGAEVEEPLFVPHPPP